MQLTYILHMVEAQWRPFASVLQWLSGKRLIMAMQETEAKTNKIHQYST